MWSGQMWTTTACLALIRVLTRRPLSRLTGISFCLDMTLRPHLCTHTACCINHSVKHDVQGIKEAYSYPSCLTPVRRTPQESNSAAALDHQAHGSVCDCMPPDP